MGVSHPIKLAEYITRNLFARPVDDPFLEYVKGRLAGNTYEGLNESELRSDLTGREACPTRHRAY